MTAKEYLSEIQKMRRLLHSLELRAEELRTQAEGMKAITYDRDKVQVSPANRMEDITIRLVEIEERYGRELVRLHEEILTRTRQIEEMRPEHAEILRLRYVEGDRPMRLEEIAVRTHMSFDRVRHLHGEALEAFRRRWL